MSDLAILGRALAEAGKALSAQAQAIPSPPRGVQDSTHSLLPKVDSVVRKLSSVEALLSAQPLAIVQGISTELNNSLEGLSQTLGEFRSQAALQNENAKQTISLLLDVRQLLHLQAVTSMEIASAGMNANTNLAECAKSVNKFIRLGDIDFPIAYVAEPNVSEHSSGVNPVTSCFPRTARDIPDLSAQQLTQLLTLYRVLPHDSPDLALEELQRLFMIHLGLVQ